MLMAVPVDVQTIRDEARAARVVPRKRSGAGASRGLQNRLSREGSSGLVGSIPMRFRQLNQQLTALLEAGSRFVSECSVVLGARLWHTQGQQMTAGD